MLFAFTLVVGSRQQEVLGKWKKEDEGRKDCEKNIYNVKMNIKFYL